MPGPIGKLLIWIGANTTELTDALASTERKLLKTGKAMQLAGSAMTKALTLPLLGLAAVAGKFAAGFEKAMTRATAITTGMTADIRKQMDETARAISRALPLSAEAAAEGYKQLAGAGYNAAQSLEALPKVAEYAVAAQIDMASAADLAARAQQVFGLRCIDPILNVQNLTRVTDVLCKANIAAAFGADTFATALTRNVGTALRTTGKGLEEGMALILSYRDKGLNARQAVKQLQIALLGLQEAAYANQLAFRDEGIAVFDSAGQMRNMADIIADFEGKLSGLTTEQRNAVFANLGFSRETAVAVQTLVGLSGKIKEYEKTLKDAGGSTSYFAALQKANLIDQLSIVKNRFVDVAISLGTAFMPAFIAAAEAASALSRILKGLAEVIAEFPEWLRTVVMLIAGFIGILGPLTFALGFLTFNMGKVITGIKNLGWALTWLGKHEVFTTIAIFTALVAGIVGYTTASGYATDATERHADALEDLQSAASGVKSKLDAAVSAEAKAQAEFNRLLGEQAILMEKMAIPKFEVPKAAWPMGGEAMPLSPVLDKVNSKIAEVTRKLATLYEEITKLRIDEKFTKGALSIETFKRATAEAEAQSKIENDELAHQERLLAATKRRYDELIALGEVGQAETIYKDVKALQAKVTALRAEQRAQVEVSEAQRKFDTSLAEAARIYEVTQDRGIELNTQLELYRGLLQRLASEGAPTERLQEIADKIQEIQLRAAAAPTSFRAWQVELAKSITTLERAAKIYGATGDKTGYLNAQLEVYQSRLEQLAAAGGPAKMLEDVGKQIQAIRLELAATPMSFQDFEVEFTKFVTSLNIGYDDLLKGTEMICNSISGGLGNAFAQAIIYGQDFGSAMMDMLKNLGASIISFIVEMVVQQLLAWILSLIGYTAQIGVKIGGEMAFGAVGAAAQAYACCPWPANLIAGPIAGAMALAEMIGLASAGWAAGKASTMTAAVPTAKGGLIQQPTLALVGEAGPEVVIPLNQLTRFMPKTETGDTIVHMYLDAKEFARAVVPKIPGVVRQRIGRR